MEEEEKFYCDECGTEVGCDGFCPCCGDPLADAWDDTGGDPDPGATREASDYDLETPIGQRLMDGEEE